MPPTTNYQQPLVTPDEDPEDIKKRRIKRCAQIVGAIAGGWFILAWILQGIIYVMMTTMNGCSASSLEGYHYPGGGTTDAGGPAYNLMPLVSMLVERDPGMFGQEKWDVIPSNQAATVGGAPVGFWSRTWGPWYYTYVYEDVANSKTTAYMRPNLLRLGSSHRIMRCDGTGSFITLEEGMNYFGNRVRYIFGMNQAYTFKLFVDGVQTAQAEETGLATGFPSLTFRKMDGGDEMASSILQMRNFHGKYDEWLVKNNMDLPVGAYITSAASLLLAEIILDTKRANAAANPTSFLELPQSTSGEDATELRGKQAEVTEPVKMQAEVTEPVKMQAEPAEPVKKQADATSSTEHV